MSIIEAILLGFIEGITEFLPISSTGHLTIAEKLLGFKIDDPALTAFTAIIQLGAVAATLLYFRKDIATIVQNWVRGVFHAGERTHDYKFGWAIIIGTIPIGIVGVLFQHQIETTLRSLWFVGIALIGWSLVMWLAEKVAKLDRTDTSATWRDTIYIGVLQCLALIPGVSRSGATISAGLFRGFNRVAATKLSFFLAIPALVAAGILQAITQYDKIALGVGWGPTLLSTAVTFVVAYASIAWLLKYISGHSFKIFIGYRIALGVVVIVLLATNTLSAT